MKRFLILLAVGEIAGFYLSTDYYMDYSHERAFGGACTRTISDVSAFINSHVNNLNMAKYVSNQDCWMTLDAGREDGARYKIEVLTWNLEPPSLSGNCRRDYLELYNSSQVQNSSLVGRFCGLLTPNLTGLTHSTQRYLTLRFRTDESNNFKGFRLLAVRQQPAPCVKDQFYCRHENQCVDSRLRCDGTAQCSDSMDETDCNAFERLVGELLSLGVGGLVVVGCAIFICCIILWVIIAYCCCKTKDKQTINNHSTVPSSRLSKSLKVVRPSRAPGGGGYYGNKILAQSVRSVDRASNVSYETGYRNTGYAPEHNWS